MMDQSGVESLAAGFRQANDSDVLQTMDVMSSARAERVNQLHYYVVAADWMRKAWPLLSGKVAAAGDEDEDAVADLKAAVGPVTNASLLVLDSNMNDNQGSNNPISDDDDEGRYHQKSLMLNELEKRAAHKKKIPAGGAAVVDESAKRRFVQKNQHIHGTADMRLGLTHTEDFFLLGPNAWLMVGQKFGYDEEIKRSCKFLEPGNASSLVVVIRRATTGRPAVYQHIPPTGRFSYESHLDCNSNRDNPQGEAAAADELPHPGNVSDDEETGDELFQMMDDEPEMLPDSTTPVAANRDSSHDWNIDGDDDDQVVETRAVMRRYGSGLGNLGNTCFMNSTLQCLAHTDPLRKYFLSGEYERDLNRDNPLGTGGDLATEFAQLLASMWRTTPSTNHGGYHGYGSSLYTSDPESTTNVVYPRDFKFTLGKHAEQFMGYDQHDSQELATYLLDALHEDTNLVTKKPYVEKPEQSENETDEEAADKAWSLHLKREDSRVLDNFMGQVKSRVRCCTEGCGRVSTTFDPFMFLSVPIPGSSKRTIPITFVPLNPNERAKNYAITLDKMASMEVLAKKVQEKISEQGFQVEIDDLAMCDVWKKDVHSWHTLDKDVEIIRDTDETVVFELAPLSEIREVEEASIADAREAVDEASLGLRNESPRQRRYALDPAELRRISMGDQWTKELENYIKSPYVHYHAFNPTKGSTEERVKVYRKLMTFVETCYKEVENVSDTAGQKRGRDMEDNEDATGTVFVHPEDPAMREIEDRADANHAFKNVKSIYDVVVLDYLSTRVRAEIVRLAKEQIQHFPDGVTIEIRMRKCTMAYSRELNIAAPMAIRIPSSTSVYGLREEIARRLGRSLKNGREQSSSSSLTGEPTTPNGVVPVVSSDTSGIDENQFGSQALLCLRRIPLSYQRGNPVRSHTMGGRQLGSLQKPSIQNFDGTKPISLASPTDEHEKDKVAELVGDHGTVFLDWPEDLAEFLDVNEYESVDDEDMSSGDLGKTRQGSKATNVLDCIEKYCQMEQLEDTEMWYCNRCKEHVRAWKQFHIFRSPPILLIHLKRFQFSPRTHRRNKISLFIDFPLTNLDLSDHVLHWSEAEKPVYDCYAVSNHYGGLGGGHYTAYALNDDGEWCYYDDSRITTSVDPKEVVSDAAYVLYYRRRDVAVGEDFVMNIQTPGMTSPALIQVDKGPHDSEAIEVSSSAAMVGDEMDVDDTEGASRTTSPMGSTDDGEDPVLQPYGDDDQPDNGDDGLPPLQ